MYPEMYPEGMEMGAEFMGIFMVFYLGILLIALAIGLATYVMQSLSLYSIADRRGIRNPWLAWLPVGNVWILGCISDQYQYVTKSQIKNKRKALLVLNILMGLVAVGILVLFADMFSSVVLVLMEQGTNEIPAEMMADFLGVFFGVMGMYLVLFGIAIAATVVYFIALYDLYRSCEPGNATLYLVLSIFISVTMPVFMLVCRKLDLGMPPRRKPAPIPEPGTNPNK